MSKYLYIYFVFPILLSVPAALPLLQVLIPFGNKRFVDARPAGRFSPEVLSMKWFRWYHGTVDDRKWLVVSRHCGQSRAVVLAVWCALLEFASQAEERGSIAAFDCESLDALLGVEDGVCAAVMRAFVRKGLVFPEIGTDDKAAVIVIGPDAQRFVQDRLGQRRVPENESPCFPRWLLGLAVKRRKVKKGHLLFTRKSGQLHAVRFLVSFSVRLFCLWV